MGEVRNELEKEYMLFKKKFDYPINPAFFHRSQAKVMEKQLATVAAHFKAEGIPETNLKSSVKDKERVKLEHRFWSEGLD